MSIDIMGNAALFFGGLGEAKSAIEAEKVGSEAGVIKAAKGEEFKVPKFETPGDIFKEIKKVFGYNEEENFLSKTMKLSSKLTESPMVKTFPKGLKNGMSEIKAEISDSNIVRKVEEKPVIKAVQETKNVPKEINGKVKNDIINRKSEASSEVAKVKSVKNKASEGVKTTVNKSDGGKGNTTGVSNAETTLDPKLGKYVQHSFEGLGKEAQDNFNKYLRENVWCDKTLSNAEKIDIMKANFDKLIPEQKVNFNVSNEVRVLKNPDYSNWGQWPDIDWPKFPGLNKDTAKNVYNEATGKIEIPNNVDRLGSPYGNNLGVVKDGHHCTQDERSICYIENKYATNGYQFDGTYYKDVIDAVKDFDIDNPGKSVDKINSIIDIQNKINGTNLVKVDAADIVLWKDDYIKFQNNPNLIELCKEKGIDSTYGVMGKAEKWMVNGELITNGGAGQINTPVSVKTLEDTALIKNVGGW
ncbi:MULTISPECIES: hypothetical protein [Clostridium]|uniref:hypothetical protein n=1 Tax=Clostridium TaxID=1485 RepID=UPI0008251FB1|nr:MULTISPECIES: hypothetical protein [Clostridium]PJI07814.1 hypothetical protein CUB90_08035 [Clostridium sp. CT7]